MGTTGQACQWRLITSEDSVMGRVFAWIRMGVCALLLFVAVTSFLGIAYWMVERHSSVRDLIAVTIVGVGWAAIGYVAYWRGWPRDNREW